KTHFFAEFKIAVKRAKFLLLPYPTSISYCNYCIFMVGNNIPLGS
ncbi:hypothetical protein Leryth_021533, partial [Lithospermum erythrorhizon]